MNRLLVLLALAAFTAQIEFTVGISNINVKSEYYYEVNLDKVELEPHNGLVTTLTLQSGALCNKVLTVLDQNFWPREVLVPGGVISGIVAPQLIYIQKGASGFTSKDPLKEAKSLELAWVTISHNKGYIKVDSVIVIKIGVYTFPNGYTFLPYVQMIEESKAFCGAGKSISNTKPGILTNCTLAKMNQIQETAKGFEKRFAPNKELGTN